MDDSSFESFGDFGDFQSADGDVDFGPFESASGASTSSGAHGPSVDTGDREKHGEDEDESLTLTPTTGSWTIASGNDGFEEIRRVEREEKRG